MKSKFFTFGNHEMSFVYAPKKRFKFFFIKDKGTYFLHLGKIGGWYRNRR